MATLEEIFGKPTQTTQPEKSLGDIFTEQEPPGAITELTAEMQAVTQGFDVKPSFPSTPVAPIQQQGALGRLGQDIKESFVEKAAEIPEITRKAQERVQAGEISEITAFGETVGAFASTIPALTTPIFERILPDVESIEAIGKAFDFSEFFDPEVQEQFTLAQEKLESGIATAGDLAEQFEEENPELVTNIKSIGKVALAALEFFGIGKGAKGGVKFTEEGIQATRQLLDKAPNFKRLIKENPTGALKIVDNLKIKKILKKEAKLTELEKLATEKIEDLRLRPEEIEIGVTEKIKRRILGKEPQLKRFFDQARKARGSDVEISAMALGAKDAKKTFSKLKTELNKKGSEIGKFRESIKDRQIPRGVSDSLLEKYDSQLEKLGVELSVDPSNPERLLLTERPDRVTSLSPAEMKKALEFREDILKLEGGTMEQLIDVRNKIRGQIAFEKESRTVSDLFEKEIARPISKEIQEANAIIIGKKQALKLEEFSSMMDLLNDFEKATSKGRNTEFLLKRLLSERDAVPKEIVAKIKEITGDDLLDTAQFSRLATEILGDTQAKGLLQQEIAKAGIQVTESLIPGKVGTSVRALRLAGEFLTKRAQIQKGIVPEIAEAEKLAQQFLDTAGGRSKALKKIQKEIEKIK